MNTLRFFTVITMLALTTACTSMFYHPERRPLLNPNELNFHPDSIFIKDDSGQNIHLWVFKSKLKKSKGTIVFFHGNAQNITTHFLNLSWVPEEGYNFIIFDYPGYGMSDGKPTPISTIKSGQTVINWVHTNIDKSPLIIYGQSLGGIIALKSLENISSDIPIKALVLDSTFYSYNAVAKSVLAKSWLTWLFQPLVYVLIDNSQSPKDFGYLNKFPKLVLHAENDPVVSFKLGQKLYENLPEPKTFWKIESKAHGDVFAIYNLNQRKYFLDFLSKL